MEDQTSALGGWTRSNHTSNPASLSLATAISVIALFRGLLLRQQHYSASLRDYLPQFSA